MQEFEFNEASCGRYLPDLFMHGLATLTGNVGSEMVN
jgi:hypothetical protein